MAVSNGPGPAGALIRATSRRSAKIAREMYDEADDTGRRVHTVAQIAAEFSVTRPTIYRHLKQAATGLS
ncbi:ArsR family transcriptional regulator [Pilimelia columellifera]|uniref:HTH arsR-type domain-containing protein n=1 Tax=Pilimelia columellifera subsp. columellifera TaxID=706583 RepID=A0ABN3NSL6_9ACTN